MIAKFFYLYENNSNLTETKQPERTDIFEMLNLKPGSWVRTRQSSTFITNDCRALGQHYIVNNFHHDCEIWGYKNIPWIDIVTAGVIVAHYMYRRSIYTLCGVFDRAVAVIDTCTV